MATKSGSSKKGSTKKSAGKKSSKKSSKTSTKRAGLIGGPTLPPPPIPVRCIIACVEKFNQCLRKGVDRATCEKRLGRCIQRCFTGGPADPGDEE